MPFDADTQTTVDAYARKDLKPRQWHTEYFDFIRDEALRNRLGEEFYTARYLYKILEGLAAEGELQVAQVRLQVLQYASIYEAAVHHILFKILADLEPVQRLREYSTLKAYSVPETIRANLQAAIHDGREIVPAYVATGRVSEAQVRFDAKARCAHDLGLITQWLCDDLIEIYEARNAIHLHAEIRKGISWGLELATKAYRRHEPFKAQIVAGLAAAGR